MIRTRRSWVVSAIAIAIALSIASPAWAETTCTLVIDAATGATRVRAGERCNERLTPASTFKVPLSLIGFDTGILIDADRPAWPYKEEYQACLARVLTSRLRRRASGVPAAHGWAAVARVALRDR